MKKLLIILIIAFTSFNVNATHIMGGEITWECIKDPADPNVGSYIFTMKVYRDCDGVTLSTFSQTIDVWDHPSVSQITLDFISNTDISPDCNVGNSGNYQLDCYFITLAGAVEEYIYVSQPVSLPGIPPVNGWHFTWDNCCRNGAISNLVILNPGSPSEGFTLRASMYPYLDALGNALPSDPCFDSSPKFDESPQTIICTGYPFSYIHNASDIELDSIVYNWDEPLEDMSFGFPYNPPINPVPIPFLAPYTVNNPLPGGVILDSQSGQISYNSNISGNFVSVIRVDAFKCGQIVASIYREIQAVLIGCPTLASGAVNLPPVFSTIVSSQNWITSFNPITGSPIYEINVIEGSIVQFNIVAQDLDLYNGIIYQDLNMQLMNNNVVDPITGNCLDPPCANFTVSYTPQTASAYFLWEASLNDTLDNVSCGNTFLQQFTIKVSDDFCPVPASNNLIIKIYVLDSIYGCTDSLASNYDSTATTDDGSCIYNEYDPCALGSDSLSLLNAGYIIGPNGSNNINPDCSVHTETKWINVLGVDSLEVNTLQHRFHDDSRIYNQSNNLIWEWNGESVPQTTWYSRKHFVNILNNDSVRIEFHSGYPGFCVGYLQVVNALCVSTDGCTDPAALNYDSLATTDDGSCTYSSSCGIIYPISGLYVDGIIDDRAVLHFDNMNTYDTNGNQICRVDQIRIKYREVGTSAWSQKNIASPTGYDANGVCNSTQKTDKNLYGLSLATTYEWRVKVWYCSGQVTSWVNAPNFTTAGECPNVGNFTAYGADPTKATFTWDNSNGPYEFARIKVRVDSISNPQTSDWFNVGGAGVSYGTFTKDKNGLTPGETYKGQARTWCDPNGGAYNALSWTAPPIVWIQPTNRIARGEAIKNLDLFPNPSKNIFNISFTSEYIQDLKIIVRNVIGEELIVEDLQQFVGEYTKQINLKDNAKGIYLLEIETNEGVINKKLILQ